MICKLSEHKTIFLNADCLWLAIDVSFSQGLVSGRDATELWRAVIKDGLLATRPQEARMLLAPLQAQGLGTHVDCPGLVIECQDRRGGARVLLKFLGQAFAFAPACLLALEAGLRHGMGRRQAQGTIERLQVRHDSAWHDIPMPLASADLQPWRACPALLGSFEALSAASSAGVLTLQTRSRWVWRQAGKLVSGPPSLSDVLNLIAQRLERFDLAWAGDSRGTWVATLHEARQQATGLALVGHQWREVHRQVGGQYPGHGHVGFISFKGVVSNALLFSLALGSFLHVGQQTSIGSGGYFVDFEPLPADQTSMEQ